VAFNKREQLLGTFLIDKEIKKHWQSWKKCYNEAPDPKLDELNAYIPNQANWLTFENFEPVSALP
jgi:hypothetical protein